MKPFSAALSFFYPGILCFLCIFLIPACRPWDRPDADWVLRTETLGVSLKEYRDAYDMATTAYSHNLLQDSGIRRGLHQRVLHDLSEHLFLELAASQNTLGISEEEIAQGIAEVRDSYPKEVFSRMLSENALSERAWKAGLRRRILMEKIAEKILEQEVEIRPEALRACFMEYCQELGKKPEEVLLTEALAEELVVRLRRQESAEMYARWLQGMRERVPLRINYALLHEVFPETRPLEADPYEEGGGEIIPPEPAPGEDMQGKAGS